MPHSEPMETAPRAVVLLATALLAAATPAAAQCHLPNAYPAADAAGRPRHAEGAGWYVNNEVVTVFGRSYVKYGLPRSVEPGELTWIGEHEGVPVYVETGKAEVYVIYVLANARCEVQPYEAHRALFVVRPDSAAAPSATAPAELGITGCPRGADLYLFPAAELAGPRWRAKLRRDSTRYLGVAREVAVLVLTQRVRAYDVVLQWRGRAWRFPVEAAPSRRAEVHARPPAPIS